MTPPPPSGTDPPADDALTAPDGQGLTRGEWPALGLIAVTVLFGVLVATAFMLSVQTVAVIVIAIATFVALATAAAVCHREWSGPSSRRP